MSFTIKNCRITVDFLFVAMLTVLLLGDKSGVAQVGILAAALHETGHLAVMHAFKVKPSKIKFTPFGIDIIKSCCINRSYKRDVLISLAGSGANIAAALVFYLFSHSAIHPFIIANLVLATFNLLPIEPLDGGQALYSMLCLKLNADRAAKMVSISSFAVLTPLAILGFLILFHSPGNYYLLIVCIYLISLLLFKNGRYY
ncbi:MAG: peptidase [Caproiciproducens sp.]|nr:peptidase [Caproiciproducens sp.]